jgi:hypothetical protein
MDKAFIYLPNLGEVMKPEEGAFSQFYIAAAAKKEELVNGAFYMPDGGLSNSRLDKVAKSEKLATELWEGTEKALDGY